MLSLVGPTTALGIFKQWARSKIWQKFSWQKHSITFQLIWRPDATLTQEKTLHRSQEQQSPSSAWTLPRPTPSAHILLCTEHHLQSRGSHSLTVSSGQPPTALLHADAPLPTSRTTHMVSTAIFIPTSFSWPLIIIYKGAQPTHCIPCKHKGAYPKIQVFI